MRRRSFLAGLTVLPALPLAARAAQGDLNIGIYPGTGKADILMADFRAYAMPFAQALGAAVGAKPKLTLFRSIRSVAASMKAGRLDVYFVPPSVAAAMLDNGYAPVARVRDQATGMLVRRKGAQVTAVALTEKESWLDLMARHTLKLNKLEGLKTYNFKEQDDVVLAMQRDYAQAGSLRSKAADKLIAQGGFEVWHTLPTTPDFTLVASSRLSAAEHDRLGAAAAALSPEAIEQLQKTIHSKVTGFVIDKQVDFSSIKQAISEAGY